MMKVHQTLGTFDTIWLLKLMTKMNEVIVLNNVKLQLYLTVNSAHYYFILKLNNFACSKSLNVSREQLIFKLKNSKTLITFIAI